MACSEKPALACCRDSRTVRSDPRTVADVPLLTKGLNIETLAKLIVGQPMDEKPIKKAKLPRCVCSCACLRLMNAFSHEDEN